MRHTILFGLVLCAACGDKDGDSGTETPPPADDTGTPAIDADGDGYSEDIDCDDADASVHPEAEELCDGVDNNCDGVIDEDVTETFYADTDGDGFGDAEDSTRACEAPSGYVADDGDCDDDSADIHPDAEEVCDDADTDEDCDGDADDADSSVALSSASTFYADTDGDGFGNPDAPQTRCDAVSGYVSDNTDCNDDLAEANPVDGCWNGPWVGELVATVAIEGFGTDVCKGTITSTIDMTGTPMLIGTGSCYISLIGTLAVDIDADIDESDGVAGSIGISGIITDDWTGTIAESGLEGSAEGVGTYAGLDFSYEVELSLARD